MAARGALAALAVGLGGLAALGAAGLSVANQSLLANLAIHLAGLACLPCLGLIASGWRRGGAMGLALAAAVAALVLVRAPWSAVAPADRAAARLEVLHFNVRHANRTSAAMAQAVLDSAADVVVLLESRPIEKHFPALAEVYPHRFGCGVDDCEITILSKLPLEAPEWVFFPFARQRFATAVVRPGGHPLRLMAVHFGKDFFARFRHAQGLMLSGEILRRRRQDGLPVLVAGDFNAAPWDPTMRMIARLGRMTQPLAWLPTWPVPAGAFGLQIDHIMTTEGLALERLAVTPQSYGSNHRGLRATVALQP
jgi:endonuclease/exonuclease/phosphatase (EEP) superfamily protein YafD